MRKHTFLFAIMPLLALALLFTACSGGEDGPGVEPEKPNSTIPVISIQPTSVDYVGATAGELNATARVSDGGTVSYQWYEAASFTNEGGTAIEGATSGTFTPQLGDKTEAFYYVVITNSKEGFAPQSKASNPARIRILTEATAAPAATVTISATNAQYVRGFGGMSNAFGIGEPARYMEIKDIDTMFHPETGLGFKILRIMIWPQPLENVISGEVEPQMNNQITYLEVVKRVNKYGGYVMASPWTPPPEWKVNQSENGTQPSYLLPANYGNYAQYLANYASAMARYGAPIYTLSIQNEPSWPASYAGCEWTSQQQVDFFKAPTVGKFLNNVPGYGGGEPLESVKIMSGEAHQNVTWNNAARDDAAANAAIDIYAYHTYGGKTNPYPAVQADTANMRKEVWMTEINHNSGEGNYLQDSTWDFVWTIADEIDNDIRCDGSNAFVYWYAKRFYSAIGDNSFGTVNGQVNPRGYVMSHWAKYATDTVRVPAVVSGHPAGGNANDLHTNSGFASNTNVKASAFRRKMNPATYWERAVMTQEDSISLVIFDKRRIDPIETQDIRVVLPEDFGAAKYVHAIISDKDRKHAPHLITLSGTGTTADFNLPANSIVSIKFSK
jgi:O-glycosyl hydrolase